MSAYEIIRSSFRFPRANASLTREQAFLWVRDWSVSRSTVRLWLKNLQIQTIYPTLDQKRVFKDRNPKIKSSVFGLISEGDLERLLARENDKRRPAKQVNYSDDSSDEIDGPQLAVATPEKLCSPPSTPAGEATPSTPASSSSCQTPRTPSESLSPADQTSEEAVTPPLTPGKRKGFRTPYALSIEEAGDYVNCEVDAFDAAKYNLSSSSATSASFNQSENGIGRKA